MDRNDEIAEKRTRLREFLAREDLEAVLLATQAYYSWYTGGGENRVAIGTDVGAAFLFATGEHDIVVTSNIEAVRLEREDLAGTEGFEVRGLPWEDSARLESEIASLSRGRRVASDTGAFGLPKLADSFAGLTYSLTERECLRYRELGRDSSEAAEAALTDLPKGVIEHEVAARLARELLARGIIPQVLLVAADERTRAFRHPLATDRCAEESVMAVLCGKRGGLIASLTRMVHFGPVPDDLRRRHEAVCAVDAAYITGSRSGRKISDVFGEGLAVYERTGFGGEWKLHHQGGPTGYQGRSYKAHAGEERTVLDRQAFAWNPSIAGTKSEDTILVLGEKQEILTAPREWPTVETGGVARADILVR